MPDTCEQHAAAQAARPAVSSVAQTVRPAMPGMHRIAALLVAFALVIEAIVLGLRLSNASAVYDDAFITLRYARNFAEGLGFVYNPGESTLGTTSPAYGLALGVLAKVTGRDPLWFANWISAVGLAAAAWFAFKLVLADFGLAPALTAVLSLAINPMLVSTWGGEWLPALAALSAGFYWYRVGRLPLAAAMLSVAVVMRHDAGLCAAVIFADALWKRKPGVLRAVAVSSGIGLVWIVIAMTFVGHVMPSTLAAKMAHGRSDLFGNLLLGFAAWGRDFVKADPLTLAIVLLAWHGALIAALRRGIWLLVGLWIAAHMSFFMALKLPFYHWYLVPVAYGVSLASGIGVAATGDYLRALLGSSPAGRAARLAVATSLVAALVISEARSTTDWVAAKPDPREQVSNRIGEWLAGNTPADSTVAYLEIGRIGYFSRRRIVDQMGLVTGGAAERVADRNVAWAVYALKPDYYLESTMFEWAGSLAQERWFPGAYGRVTDFTAEGFPAVVTLYRRLPDAVFPPPPVMEGLQLRGSRIVGEILPGVVHGQTFVAGRNGLAVVETRLATMARTNHGAMMFRLEDVDSHSVIHEERFDMAVVVDNEWHAFRFPGIRVSKGRQFRFTIEALDASPGNAITIWYNEQEIYPKGRRLKNDVVQTGDLTLRLFYF